MFGRATAEETNQAEVAKRKEEGRKGRGGQGRRWGEGGRWAWGCRVRGWGWESGREGRGVDCVRRLRLNRVAGHVAMPH
ncbi:MAG: hypothetical protein ACKESB_03530 [Candidatus Hodgkinia cicadicola]